MVNSSRIPEQTPVKFLKLNIPCLACLQAYYKHIRKGVVTVQNILAIYLRVTEFIKSFCGYRYLQREKGREKMKPGLLRVRNKIPSVMKSVKTRGEPGIPPVRCLFCCPMRPRDSPGKGKCRVNVKICL